MEPIKTNKKRVWRFLTFELNTNKLDTEKAFVRYSALFISDHQIRTKKFEINGPLTISELVFISEFLRILQLSLLRLR